MRRRLIALSIAPVMLALAACGSNSPSPSTPATPSTPAGSASGGASAVSVGESEFKLSPADATVKAGKVTVTIKNTGTITHALALEGAGPGGKDLKSSPLQPGQTKTLTVTLKAGKIEWYCPIDGHKSMGMVGHLTVTS
ncbi:MAG: hypothetical protein QOF12_1066 [Solirubrobacteraceae bacterium]|jgi:uncharacterized cupredoxin-like copper-binding protein|nr:hypothetical protein [Solirubrobacteraceae bacterium]